MYMYCVLNIQVCLVHSSTTLSTLTTVLWLLAKNAGKKPRSGNPRLRNAKQKASVGQSSENLLPSSSTVSAKNQPLTSMQYDTQTAATQHPLLSLGPLQPPPQITPSLAYCPPPLLSQATNQLTGPLQPKPLVANTPPVPPPPPLIHSVGTPLTSININQQPTSCSHTSLTVNQPCFSLESTPPYQIAPQGYPLSLLQIHSEHHSSKPFFVKLRFLHNKLRCARDVKLATNEMLRDILYHLHMTFLLVI